MKNIILFVFFIVPLSAKSFDFSGVINKINIDKINISNGQNQYLLPLAFIKYENNGTRFLAANFGYKTTKIKIFIVGKNYAIYIFDRFNENTNLKMVKTGIAYVDRNSIQYMNRPTYIEFYHAEKYARDNQLGLWRNQNENF